MPKPQNTLSLEEVVIAVYSALDDALREAKIPCHNGKLIPRSGPAPEVDDREILCMALLQELFGFESDHFFYRWLETNPTMKQLFPRRLSRPNWADRRALLTPLIERLSKTFASMDGEDAPPLFIIDSHPVNVCRPVRAGKKKRLRGLARKGYCASLKLWFHGVREHLIFTPQGRIAFSLQIAGNRHDVNGLYALLKTDFKGHLLGDNAYWPKAEKRSKLAKKEITITADTHSNWHIKNPPDEQELLDIWRGRVERRIGLFDTQFHAGRTLCRSLKHYLARRWTKTFAHNFSRHLNTELDRPEESMMHYQLAA